MCCRALRRDRMRSKVGRWRKRIVSSVLEELEKEDPFRGKAQRYGARGKRLSNWRESLLCRSRDQRWRTKLDFSSGESFDDHHSAHHTWDKTKDHSDRRRRPLARFAVPRRAAGRKVARWWHVCELARKPKLRMRTKPSGRRCNRKRRKNSSRDRVSNFCSLLCAESRQRNVTLPSANETRRWLEMATR